MPKDTPSVDAQYVAHALEKCAIRLQQIDETLLMIVESIDQRSHQQTTLKDWV